MRSLLGRSGRRPDITFYANGRIDISARLARCLTLSDGDCIDVGEDGGEYYVYVRHRYNTRLQFRYEAVAHPTKRRSHNFRAYSRRLCAAVLTLAGSDTKAALQAGEVLEDDCYGLVVPIIIARQMK